MKYNIPKQFMGVPIEGAMERALADKNSKPENPASENNQLTLNDIIILENPILNYNWFDTHKELYKQNLRMLTIPEFLELLKLSRQKDKSLYERITKSGTPERYEWLDADFKVKNNQLYINTYHEQDSNGKLIPKVSEILSPCLMQDKIPGIDLEYWIENHTKQGLPLEKNPDGSLWYRAPMKDDKSVARFDAGSGRACFYYDRYPSDSDGSLGIRFVRSASR